MTPILTYLTEIERRADAATKGPWRVNKKSTRGVIRPDGQVVAECVARGITNAERMGNRAFIAACPTDVPRLTRALRRAVEAINAAPHAATCDLLIPVVCNCWKSATLSAIEEELKL